MDITLRQDLPKELANSLPLNESITNLEMYHRDYNLVQSVGSGLARHAAIWLPLVEVVSTIQPAEYYQQPGALSPPPTLALEL